MVDLQTIDVMRENQLRYKEDLDKQRQQKLALMAYGNMSQAEKQLNRQDLQSFKRYELTQHATLPGHSQTRNI